MDHVKINLDDLNSLKLNEAFVYSVCLKFDTENIKTTEIHSLLSAYYKYDTLYRILRKLSKKGFIILDRTTTFSSKLYLITDGNFYKIGVCSDIKMKVFTKPNVMSF